MWLTGRLLLGGPIRHTGSSSLRWLHFKRREVYSECFRILGVHESADQNTVRHAYLDLVKRVHPDSGSEEASAERFQQVDEAFRVLQEKFAKGRRNIQEDEEEEMEFDIKHTAPQHRQYLSNEGYGIGTPFQRQKQYQQVRAMQAQQRVLDHRIDKAAAGENTLMSKGEGGNHFRKHAVKTKYGIERVVEDLIQEAMSKGDFDNLNGVGKPLSSAQSQTPYLDFTTHKLNKIMLDNGFTPEWISLSKDIREAVAELKEMVRQERIYYGEWPLQRPEELDAWQAFTQQHQEQVGQLNKLIDKYNLLVPILKNQFFRQNLDTMAERVFKEPQLQRNVKRGPTPEAKINSDEQKQQSPSTSIFSLFSNLL